MEALQSNAAQVGIKLNLQPKPINQVLATSWQLRGGEDLL